MERELAASETDMLAINPRGGPLDDLLRSRGFDPTTRELRRRADGYFEAWAERLPCYDLSGMD